MKTFGDYWSDDLYRSFLMPNQKVQSIEGEQDKYNG